MTRHIGQSIAEYCLVIALCAIACIPALGLLRSTLNNTFSGLGSLESEQAKIAIIPTGKGTTATNQTTGSLKETLSPDIAAVKALDAQAEQEQTTIRVAGSNGTVETVYANSATFTRLAEKYKDSAPELSNAVIELGRLGQKMADALKRNDKAAQSAALTDFTAHYLNKVALSDVYSQLSAEDKSLIKSLTNQSAKLTASNSGSDIWGYGDLEGYMDGVDSVPTASVDSATQVNNNSAQTRQCGENLKCN